MFHSAPFPSQAKQPLSLGSDHLGKARTRRAVCPTVKALGKCPGLLCYSELNRDEQSETLIMARKGRRFKAVLVQPQPHFGHFCR